jgi:hypothetical protein
MMVSRRRSILGLKSVEASFAEMSPELRAVYLRMYRQELAYRRELFAGYPTFLINEIPDAYGNRLPASKIRRWIRERQCFAYRHQGRFRFPAFQFVNGGPKAVVARVIGLLYPMDGWVVMYWFAAANSWLKEGTSPVSVLDTDPDAVLAAASHANDLISD